MCRMWARIRHGVRWDRTEQTELALKALNLKEIKSLDISFDPFFKDTATLRDFWHKMTVPKVRATNPKMRLNAQIRSDGQPPYFVAHLQNGKRLMFKTEGFHIADLLMRLNRLLGNPEQAPRGVPFEEEEEIMDYKIEDRIRELSRKKTPGDFLS